MARGAPIKVAANGPATGMTKSVRPIQSDPSCTQPDSAWPSRYNRFADLSSTLAPARGHRPVAASGFLKPTQVPRVEGTRISWNDPSVARTVIDPNFAGSRPVDYQPQPHGTTEVPNCDRTAPASHGSDSFLGIVTHFGNTSPRVSA